MNKQSIPNKILRKITSPFLRTGSVVFFERELSVPVPRAAPPPGFTVRLASLDDLELLKAGLPGRTELQLRERFERGDLCMVAIDAEGKLAHASWVALTSAWIPELEMTLTIYPGEAYGYDFYTRAELRKSGIFAAARQLACDHLHAIGFQRFFSYVTGENAAGLEGASTWQQPMGRLSYARVRGTKGMVWGKCPFTLTRAGPRGRPAITLTAPPKLRVEVISDAAAMLALRPTWDELVNRAGLDHPFLTHDWISAWWEAFGGDRELRVLVVYAGDTCIAIAPLMSGRTSVYGIPVRSLGLTVNDHTPRSGFVVAERNEEAYSAVLQALADMGERWEMLVLPQLAEGSPTLTRMEGLAKGAGINTGTWKAPPSPRLELKGTWDSYLKSLKPKKRTNLRNRLNRLSRLGAIEFEEITGGEQLHQALEDGLRIEAAGWKGDESTAMSSSPESNRFYRRFAEAAAARGWLCLNFLKVDGKRIAFTYGLRYGNIRYLVKQGYDPAYGAVSPSQVLCAFTLEDAFRRGESAIDFLGTDEPWKAEWTQESKAHSWLYLFQPGLSTWPIHFAKFRLLPALRERWSASRL